MARALREMLSPPQFDPTSFENAEGYDELVVVSAVPFFSLCEHHVLPFTGTATIGYVPAGRIAGLSKLAWAVQLFARRLQVQERMTAQIADWLMENLQPLGAGVQLRAEHLCMSLRGARAAGALTTTTARRGVIAEDAARREDWLRALSAAGG
jgi:GTP cyclohydrolase I